MTNKLILHTGEDIPFKGARTIIHQPSISEISFISEKSFHIGSRFLNFSIEDLPYEDKIGLENKTDFEIFMQAMNGKESYIMDSLLVLTLLFPDYSVRVEKNKILLLKENDITAIDDSNYTEFKDIISSMFCLDTEEGGKKYNPADKLAAKIADKLKKAQAKTTKQKDENFSIYGNYLTILSVGNHQDINELKKYTVYQLLAAMKRFQMSEDFKMYIKAKMAGAQDLEEVKNWMEIIH